MDAGIHIIKMQKARNQANFFISWIQEVCLRTVTSSFTWASVCAYLCLSRFFSSSLASLRSHPHSSLSNGKEFLWEKSKEEPWLVQPGSYVSTLHSKESHWIMWNGGDEVVKCYWQMKVGRGTGQSKIAEVHCTWVNAKGIIRNCKLDKVISVWTAECTKRTE